jgi:hypothetical protein
LLEKKLNRAVRDDDFPVKRNKYRKGTTWGKKKKPVPPSTMVAVVGPITAAGFDYRPLIKYKAATFGDLQIKTRQRQLAKLAPSIWEIK